MRVTAPQAARNRGDTRLVDHLRALERLAGHERAPIAERLAGELGGELAQRLVGALAPPSGRAGVDVAA